MWALQEFSARNCELVSPLRGISCASGKLSCLRRSIFLAPPAHVLGANCLESSLWQRLWRRGKKYTWDLSYSEGRGESTLKRRAFWSVTMTFPSKVQPAGGSFELQTLYGACRVFVLKSSKSQDILVKIGCFTQNGDLSNTHTSLYDRLYWTPAAASKQPVKDNKVVVSDWLPMSRCGMRKFHTGHLPAMNL